MDDPDALVEMHCMFCGDQWHVARAIKAWLEASGAEFHCPFCGRASHFSGGDLANARRQFVRHMRDSHNNWRWSQGRGRGLVRLCRTIGALRGVITKMRKRIRAMEESGNGHD